MQTQKLKELEMTPRIRRIKGKSLVKERFVSVEQARIITKCYQEHEGEPIARIRALSFREACEKIEITIDPDELIVGNRTKEPRAGVIFPEGGITWVAKEIDELGTRKQDPFTVRPEDKACFFQEILPYWRGKTLEDRVEEEVGSEIAAIKQVVKINQTDHAQGHICPNSTLWLKKGPARLGREAREKQKMVADEEKRLFYECVAICMEGAVEFILRYGELAEKMAEKLEGEQQAGMQKVAWNCKNLAVRPARNYHEALQSVWFLFVLLHLESNASSFSPGRMDQTLLPYYQKSLAEGMTLEEALELTESLWLKFNQVVYLRNEMGARYFAGFPIGFNLAVGGRHKDGSDATNELSFLFLKAQSHVRLPQPNLSVRLHKNSPKELLREVTRVISKGGGMPQIFNDESIIPALERQGIDHKDACDYAIVGCVELTTQGNNLGWSDAAMFNMVKALELATNNGVCLLSGKQVGPETGYLTDFHSFEEFEKAFQIQVDHFIDRMMPVTFAVDRIHAEVLPSAMLSSVIDDSMEKGIDVTAGGAKYNFSGIQLIQVANIADSLAALKKLVFEEKKVGKEELLEALRTDFEGKETLRKLLLEQAPKYGNDVDWVDELAVKWHEYFARRLEAFKNVRGGRVQTGLYTVSAHVPMGLNIGATPDGRKAGSPLADGGVSAVYGRDKLGPTALLNSVSKLHMELGSNGTLLNMKFLPEFFDTQEGIDNFCALLETLVELKINHCQINVVRREDLIAAKKTPEQFSGLTIRVAGYTAFFVELADDLQDEIIARTAFGGND